MTPRLSVTALLLLLVASPAMASFGGGKKDDPPPPPAASSSAEQLTPRQQAEALYNDGYDEMVKAKQDYADGKSKNAEKKLKRSLDRGTRATELDTTYYEAYNLVGYASRKLGKYDDALAAYQRCLRLKPDYAPAREYLGEAYVELKQLDKAKEQLAYLERLNATDDATTLRTAIEAAEKTAAPAAAASTPGGK